MNTIFTQSIFQQSCLHTLSEITMYRRTSTHSYYKPNKSNPIFPLHFFLTLTYNYPPKFHKWFFMFRFSKQILHSLLLYYMQATWHIFITFLPLILLIISGEEYQTWTSLQNLLHLFLPPSHIKYSPHPPLSQTLHLLTRHQLSHTHKMTGIMLVLQISTCNILNWKAARTACTYPAIAPRSWSFWHFVRI